MYYPIAETIGIEIEAASLTRNVVRNHLSNLGILDAKVVSDGSIRSFGESIFGMRAFDV
jgi:hypothetical protein